MSDAATLDLPEFDPADVSLSGADFHAAMEGLSAQSWIARVPLGYLTLDRDAGEFFLRLRAGTFPGQMLAELYGVDSGPLREEIDNNILHLDGERHRRLRNVLNPFFTPRAADRWRPAMRAIIADIAAPIVARGECEFVDAVARRYPAQVIATVMGAPLEDAPQLEEWANVIQGQFDPVKLQTELPALERAAVEFQDFRHPVYPQSYPGFEPHLSALDLVCHCGPGSIARIRATREAA